MKKVEYTLMPTNMPSVNISSLSQGKSAQIVKKVHTENVDVLIVKNNKPYAVIMPYSTYSKGKGIKNEK